MDNIIKLKHNFNLWDRKKGVLHYDVVAQLIYENFRTKDVNFLIIGVMDGWMEKHLLKIFKNIKITSIEIKNINPFNENELKKINFIGQSSDEAIEKVKNQKFDFLYIDGDHSYEQCYKDILNYSPLVRNGGIIAGHDYHPHWGVIQAVNELFKDNFYLGDDLTWWVEKKEGTLENFRN